MNITSDEVKKVEEILKMKFSGFINIGNELCYSFTNDQIKRCLNKDSMIETIENNSFISK